MVGNRSWQNLLAVPLATLAVLASSLICRGEDELGKKLASQVTIHRDEWGVPHIDAASAMVQMQAGVFGATAPSINVVRALDSLAAPTG